MKEKKNSKILALDKANAAVLVEIITGPNISESLQIQAMQKLVGDKEHQDFFLTMFDEKLSFGECTKCGHENHFLIPEDSLNQMGWVSNDEDERVPRYTNSKICVEFEESCKKKKILI